MGTTIVALKVEEGSAHLAHVGDSRIYLYRGGDLMHMTRDHSWFADLMANAHEFTPQTLAYAARYKNVITRALGMEASVEVDLGHVELEEGDLEGVVEAAVPLGWEVELERVPTKDREEGPEARSYTSTYRKRPFGVAKKKRHGRGSTNKRLDF